VLIIALCGVIILVTWFIIVQVQRWRKRHELQRGSAVVINAPGES
jgi:predicted permease